MDVTAIRPTAGGKGDEIDNQVVVNTIPENNVSFSVKLKKNTKWLYFKDKNGVTLRVKLNKKSAKVFIDPPSATSESGPVLIAARAFPNACRCGCGCVLTNFCGMLAYVSPINGAKCTHC